jgi:hypothetical protein
MPVQQQGTQQRQAVWLYSHMCHNKTSNVCQTLCVYSTTGTNNDRELNNSINTSIMLQPMA